MKKVCLEKKLSIKDINEEIDISEHEVEKFLLIFHLLMETVNSEESLDNNDGIVSDTILKIVLKISQLLKNNIDWLKIPEIFKIALKKIKSLFNLQTDQNAEHTGERDGMGVKNIENRRVRKRRFKIKITMEQPRNVKVRQNGRVILRMVVRSKTIYPGVTRRNHY